MRYILFLALLINFPCFASRVCPQADPVTSPNFCSSFKYAAKCHCVSSGLPDNMCDDMNEIYNRMMAIFGSVERACRYQQDTAPQICMDDWKCYRSGGTDSQGNLCSSTGNPCQRTVSFSHIN